ncbi:hypothetical protein V6N00_00300 [Tersicoccus sp. MR15.9]|uniref:hypothetical protein n=1 Tax=Tersicoccus mangrovi TaxID=3121635 RepID=UPI002FE636C3
MRTGVGRLPMPQIAFGAQVTVRLACRGTGTIHVVIAQAAAWTADCHPGEEVFEESNVRMVTRDIAGSITTIDPRAFVVSVAADKRQQWAVTVSERPVSAPVRPASPTTTAPARR